MNQQTSICASGSVAQAQLRNMSINSEDSGLNVKEKQSCHQLDCYPESLCFSPSFSKRTSPRCHSPLQEEVR